MGYRTVPTMAPASRGGTSGSRKTNTGAHKRDAILISSDNEEHSGPASKQTRTSGAQNTSFNRSAKDAKSIKYESSAVPNSAHPGSQAGYNAGEDDFGANELVAWSQDENTFNESLEHYGTLSTKIVGIRYYDGHATLGEHVLLRREPKNPYDSNAIRVDNVQLDQIGHVPRQVAAKLAPYMDESALLLEARLSGARGEFDCPMEVAIYGTTEPSEREQLKARMLKDRLPLEELKRKERERARAKKQEEADRKRREKEQKKRERAAELRNAAKKGVEIQHKDDPQWAAGASSCNPTDTPADEDSLENIAMESEHYNPREVQEAVEKYGADEDALSKLPEAEQPERLATAMLPYQLQGLAWMVDRENLKLPQEGSTDSVQLWKCSTEKAGLFTNIATNFTTSEPKLASGGILADDMGLGKTLEIISLIISDSDLGRSSTDGSTATLIIAPLGVMSNWTAQMEMHIKKSEPLRILTYHGAGKGDMKPSDFAEYDVVVTTYGTLTNEYFGGRGGKDTKPPAIPRKTGLYSTNWKRVVLDEGHNIRNPATKGSLAATAIMARSRWAITGTPIINNLKDLYSLVRYIGITGGLENLGTFNSKLMRPLRARNRDPNSTLLLQALIATLCLRRRKDMAFIDLKLPKLDEYIHRIQFKEHEEKKYKALEAEAKGYLRKYQQDKEEETGSTQNTYRNLLEVLLRLRQVCNHWQLCGERVTSIVNLLEAQKVVDLTPENSRALQDMLQLSIESRDECGVCFDELIGHSPVITTCGHIFGRECITRCIEIKPSCPMCRAELKDESALVEPAKDLGVAGSQENFGNEDEVKAPSSKIEALLKILKAAHRKKDTKFVIFSQWCRFLDLLEPHLDEAGYTYARLDGTMPATARDASLRSLADDPETTILLASLSVAGVGLNLTAANQVILCDTWWAPAIEDQAVDRVHRLGQKKNCSVWRLVMDESVENGTLKIQEEKRKLVAEALRENRGRGAGSQTRVGDIERLLG